MKLWIKKAQKPKMILIENQIIFDGVFFHSFSSHFWSHHSTKSTTLWKLDGHVMSVTVTMIYFRCVIQAKCSTECQHYNNVFVADFNFRFIAVIALHFASSTFRFVLFSYFSFILSFAVKIIRRCNRGRFFIVLICLIGIKIRWLGIHHFESEIWNSEWFQKRNKMTAKKNRLWMLDTISNCDRFKMSTPTRKKGNNKKHNFIV